jgi:hypothetical protein
MASGAGQDIQSQASSTACLNSLAPFHAGVVEFGIELDHGDRVMAAPTDFDDWEAVARRIVVENPAISLEEARKSAKLNGGDAPMSPLNYVWFQYRWQRLAAKTFEADGDQRLVRFWDCFHATDRVPVGEAATPALLAPLLNRSQPDSWTRSPRLALGPCRARSSILDTQVRDHDHAAPPPRRAPTSVWLLQIDRGRNA